MSEGGVSNCWVLKSTLYGACTHNINTFQLIQKELKKKGERKILKIRQSEKDISRQLSAADVQRLDANV